MKIAYNPTDKPNITSEQLGLFNKDIIFDLSGLATYARGVQVGKVYQKFLKSTNSTTIGYDGLVPFPDYNSNSKNRFLKEDGTWVIPDAGTFDGMDSDRFVTTHNISEADTDKRSINVRFEPKWTNTSSSSYILRVGSSTEGLPDNNCGDGNLLHIQGRFSDTAFLLLSGWYNNSLYFRSGNEVDGVDNTTKEEADTGLFKNAWNRIPFFTDLTGSNIKLTGYLLDANNFESITSNDTVSSALSKLECKTLFVYDWLMSDADDADEKINKWHEVEHFLEGIEETTLNSILNTKAAKATTIQGYGLWEKYTDLNDVPMGAFFCGGNSVANSPESGNCISGITLAKDKNAQFRTQLGFVNNRIFTRQEHGANNWSQWRELAFLGDVAKKATTLAGYGITDAVPYLETSEEIKKSAIGYGYPNAGFASAGGFISAIHHNGKYGFQLNATNTGSYIWYRGLNNGTFTEWKRLAFKETTLSGYGITDAVPFINTLNASNLKSIGVGYVTANGANGANGGIISFGSASHQTQIHSDYLGGNIHWRVNRNGTLTDWKNLLDSHNYSNYAVTLGTEQIVTGRKTFKNDGYYTGIFNSTLSDGKVRLLLMSNNEAKLMLAYDGLGSSFYDYGSAQTLKIQNDGDLLFTKSIIASSQLKSNVATGTAPLVVNSTTMVANLNANYLGGLNKDSYQKAVYDYVNVSGTADTTALPTVIAPSNYNGTNSIGGNFKYYDTKFFSTQTNTSNRCQLAYGYDVDSIHFRRYKDGTWYDWKKLAFTEGTDNLKITNTSARITYVKDSTHSMFFGYSDGSYNRGLYDNSLNNWIMYTDSSNQTFINQWLGNVGIKTGNATLTAALQVGGSILASGDITAYSDRRLKSNIQTLENRGYVKPVTFEKDGKQCIGFVAQDVEEKYPELVNSEGEYLSLNYQQYTAVLQALIIELDKRIKELENGFSKL